MREVGTREQAPTGSRPCAVHDWIEVDGCEGIG